VLPVELDESPAASLDDGVDRLGLKRVVPTVDEHGLEKVEVAEERCAQLLEVTVASVELVEFRELRLDLPAHCSIGIGLGLCAKSELELVQSREFGEQRIAFAPGRPHARGDCTPA
jgi:hypothetical protein